jgi:hypothetical protein
VQHPSLPFGAVPTNNLHNFTPRHVVTYGTVGRLEDDLHDNGRKTVAPTSASSNAPTAPVASSSVEDAVQRSGNCSAATDRDLPPEDLPQRGPQLL